MGLINNEMDQTQVKPVDPAIAAGTKVAEAKPVTYDATTRAVDPATQTVAGQVNNIIKDDSPLMQRARAGAMESANSRGLINSTMAAQAGQAAVIDAATPIANADANINTTAARDNQNVTNAATAAGADAVNKAAVQSAEATNSLSLQQMKGTQATGLANIEANYKQLLQASDSASKILTSAQTAIAAVQADPNTSVEQKQAAVQKVSQLLESGLSVLGSISNIDLAGLLNFQA